jgi:hypothetical protein
VDKVPSSAERLIGEELTQTVTSTTRSMPRVAHQVSLLRRQAH